MRYDDQVRGLQTTCVCGGNWIPEEGCEVPINDVDDTGYHRPVLGRGDVEWVICSRCEGDGTLGGYPGVYTQDDFAQDPDFFEDYMRHTRSCEDCGGTGKMLQVTEEAEARPEVQEWLRDWWETEAIYESERRMGA
jgi:hypothetical protein